jgi:hypothetical protein
VHIIAVPSNQHLNIYYAQWKWVQKIVGKLITYVKGRRFTEQDWAVPTCREMVAEMIEQGHEAEMVWREGKGTSSLDELALMMAEVKAKKPDMVVSLHSDVGTYKRIYPLIRGNGDYYWAQRIATNLAKRLGFRVKNPTVRLGLMFFTRMKALPYTRMILLEVGYHSKAEGAAFNRAYCAFEGKMAARAVLEASGCKLLYDGPVEGPVPPGLEKWKA